MSLPCTTSNSPEDRPAAAAPDSFAAPRADCGCVGRFAPSPTGPLHLGSLACAMASFADVRARGGTWLVRIEDIDPPRDMPGADVMILDVLAAYGMTSDIPVLWQHTRGERYREIFEALKQQGAVYGCACSRADIFAADAALGLPHGVYPGTCRSGTHGRPVRAWRFRTSSSAVRFVDRECGEIVQNVEKEVGDFIVKRADGLWAYQLAVVIDDMDQCVTDIVRGQDLLDNTPRQILLQRAIGAIEPRYMHIPLVTDAHGEKLSKQRCAAPVATENRTQTLDALWVHLGFEPIGADSVKAFWKEAVEQWKERWCASMSLPQR